MIIFYKQVALYCRITFDDEANENKMLFCHSACYKLFTDKTKIERAQKQTEKEQDKLLQKERTPLNAFASSPKITRSSQVLKQCRKRAAICTDICIICKKKEKLVSKIQGKSKLVQCLTSDAGRLREAAEKKKDEDILLHIRDKDCSCIELKYHKHCYAKYTAFVTRKKSEKPKSLYEQSFLVLSKQIEKQLYEDGESLSMSDIFSSFVKIVKSVESLDASKYNKWRLKKKIRGKFPELVFYKPIKKAMSEIVYHSNFNIGSIIESAISAAREQNSSSFESDCTDDEVIHRDQVSCSSKKTVINSLQILYTAAVELKNILKQVPAINCKWPPKATELNFKCADEFVPTSLFNFLAWTFGFSDEPTFECKVELDVKDRVEVLSVAQDFIFLHSKRKNLPPKHLALSMATRQITGSKKLISILNGFGHCVSNSVVRSHETGLAKLNINDDVVIGSNVNHCQFTTLVWDNIDFGEETRSGSGTSHMANGIIIQMKMENSKVKSKESVKNIKKSERSLPKPYIEIPQFILGEKKSPELSSSYRKNPFSIREDEHLIDQSFSRLINFGYILCKVNDSNTLLPGWTGFKTLLHAKPLNKSIISYLPVINAPVTEISTVNEILQKSIAIADKLGFVI
ncbi:uncharacterized protein LOC136096644 [Hydra vulgaris]|uniref:uncharacterized protein LOC136096644 n=1 Tax=Hydra vulgaris TaxID=6087 RepID=UPI0032EA3716